MSLITEPNKKIEHNYAFNFVHATDNMDHDMLRLVPHSASVAENPDRNLILNHILSNCEIKSSILIKIQGLRN